MVFTKMMDLHHVNASAKKRRPSMTTLRDLIGRCRWRDVQDAIRIDPTVSLRIDDSAEEDAWFFDRRLNNAVDSTPGIVGLNREVNGLEESSQLRYWVAAGGDHILRRDEFRQRRTLLHSLCRMSFDTVETWSYLADAVRTAEMLIASSNDYFNVDRCRSSIALQLNNSGGNNDGIDDDSLRRFHRPILLPAVERRGYQEEATRRPTNEEGNDEDNEDDDDERRGEDISQVQNNDETAINDGEAMTTWVSHTSVLTMTDASGETPLHALTGAGAGHIDFIKLFINACRRPGDLSQQDDKSTEDRRPTVYDLLVAQNYHGCTPLHFLADTKNQEAIVFLLEQCQVPCGAVHPLMVCDDDGDLPLHFACCNGANELLLRVMTTPGIGDPMSATIRNSKQRLAIDDFIEWFVENIEENDASEGEDEASSDNDVDCVDISNEISDSWDDSWDKIIIRQVHGRRSEYDELVNLSYGLPRAVMKLLILFDLHLFKVMAVLSEAAARAVGNCEGMNYFHTHPIHTAVIATKYFDFPILALTSCMWSRVVYENRSHENMLLEEDSYTFLPLTWACAGAMRVTFYSDVDSISHTFGQMNRTCWRKYFAECPATIRFNTMGIGSMIEFLMSCEPDAARETTRDGMLPLHRLVADSSGGDIIWEQQVWNDIKILLKEFPESIGKPDPTNRLYPFQIAAMASSLTNTFLLMMEYPSLLCQLLERTR